MIQGQPSGVGSQPQQEVSMDAKGQWRDGKKIEELGSNPEHSMSLGTLTSLSLSLFVHKMGTSVPAVHGRVALQ